MQVDPQVLRALAGQAERVAGVVTSAEVGTKVVTAADGLPGSTTQWAAHTVGDHFTQQAKKLLCDVMGKRSAMPLEWIGLTTVKGSCPVWRSPSPASLSARNLRKGGQGLQGGRTGRAGVAVVDHSLRHGDGGLASEDTLCAVTGERRPVGWVKGGRCCCRRSDNYLKVRLRQCEVIEYFTAVVNCMPP